MKNIYKIFNISLLGENKSFDEFNTILDKWFKSVGIDVNDDFSSANSIKNIGYLNKNTLLLFWFSQLSLLLKKKPSVQTVIDFKKDILVGVSHDTNNAYFDLTYDNIKQQFSLTPEKCDYYVLIFISKIILERKINNSSYRSFNSVSINFKDFISQYELQISHNFDGDFEFFQYCFPPSSIVRVSSSFDNGVKLSFFYTLQKYNFDIDEMRTKTIVNEWTNFSLQNSLFFSIFDVSDFTNLYCEFFQLKLDTIDVSKKNSNKKYLDKISKGEVNPLLWKLISKKERVNNSFLEELSKDLTSNFFMFSRSLDVEYNYVWCLFDIASKMTRKVSKKNSFDILNFLFIYIHKEKHEVSMSFVKKHIKVISKLLDNLNDDQIKKLVTKNTFCFQSTFISTPYPDLDENTASLLLVLLFGVKKWNKTQQKIVVLNSTNSFCDLVFDTKEIKLERVASYLWTHTNGTIPENIIEELWRDEKRKKTTILSNFNKTSRTLWAEISNRIDNSPSGITFLKKNGIKRFDYSKNLIFL